MRAVFKFGEGLWQNGSSAARAYELNPVIYPAATCPVLNHVPTCQQIPTVTLDHPELPCPWRLPQLHRLSIATCCHVRARVPKPGTLQPASDHPVLHCT